ncbi:hypothetical protein [Streptomyces mirabilis]|uniref:hypothetical protein n=1 Tax=Streptomyces mirabilis TaxID=68239 RepID=UPI002254F4B4|nr:hypothetical protein [Streptomyces mirabilis]MCX4428333.1 hypothetical protein [Streptomyces mirabilis]
MGETSARDRLAGELQKLKDASGLSYTQIETQGRKQTPIVKLGRGKLSNWFKGDYVPEDDKPFQYLIRLLEPRAEKNGLVPRGINWWRDRRKEAADERDASAVSKEPADRSAQLVAPAVAAPHVSDVAKAARLLRILPLDGSWLRWLENAETMFKVPLTVSDLVCDAHRPLETDRPDYVDPELQEAHRELVEALGALCYELNGMNDISDEGQDVLEISYPGTSAERNELNRQACRARDEFIPAYTKVINLLNVKGLLPPVPARPSTSPSGSVPPPGSQDGTPTLPPTLSKEGQPHAPAAAPAGHDRDERRDVNRSATGRVYAILSELKRLRRDPNQERELHLLYAKTAQQYEHVQREQPRDEEVGRLWQTERGRLIQRLEADALDITDTELRQRVKDALVILECWEEPFRQAAQVESRTRWIVTEHLMQSIEAYRDGQQLPDPSEAYGWTRAWVLDFLAEWEASRP